ncbi:hypothetical protein [Roseateles sp. BYS87W]|uniref:hypothetical protein n=1 Tax=Pelomonas baiyunensis TaxID=3299026 RepID=UPI00374A830A
MCLASASDRRGRPLGAPADDGRQLLAQQALRWTHVVRSRQRWVHDPALREQLEASARESLAALGLDEARLDALAREPLLVVRMPFRHEALGWEGRVLPWEYLLAAATRSRRRSPTGRPQPLTVIRELQVQLEDRGQWTVRPPPRVALPRPPRALFVAALPPELRAAWPVDAELAQFRRALPADVVTLRVLQHPSLDELAQALREFQPTLLHIAGVDAHQGLRELQRLGATPGRVSVRGSEPGAAAQPWALDALLADRHARVDGLLLRGPEGEPQLVPAQVLARVAAQAAQGAEVPIYLTTFNVWNSAARLAPLMVGEGASLAAVGFQDAFDDALAEFMLVQLLQGLFANGFDLPRAFERAWLIVRELPGAVDATGVTLWAGAPVLAPPAAEKRRPRREAEPVPRGAPPEPVRARPPVRCQIEPLAELNFAALHNAQPLFRHFVLSCDDPAQAAPVDIEVTLDTGTEQVRFERHLTLQLQREKLAERIHLPLAADTVRGLREAVLATLRVRVVQGAQVLHDDSHRLRLLPADQWRDNAHDGRWLPSFVLPRDPAVSRVVQQAQRYNRVLRDDPSAGFEGYQGVPATALGRSGPADDALLRRVDCQVEALWAALLHDRQLGYINPPPAYSAGRDSQRLRTPSTVEAEGAGTCIDLALLFAACLELVDIHPVIFLLDGHALPGWWRHDSFRDEYLGLREMSQAGLAEAAADSGADPARGVSWQAGRASWPEVATWIRERKLVPLEAVKLTQHGGFIEAIEAGIAALGAGDRFESLLDIRAARRALVTPLPWVGGAP